MSKSLVYTYKKRDIFNNFIKLSMGESMRVPRTCNVLNFSEVSKKLLGFFGFFFWHWCSLVLPEHLKCNTREECTDYLVLTPPSGATLDTFRHKNHFGEPVFLQCLWPLHYVATNVILCGWCQRWHIWCQKFIIWCLRLSAIVETDRFGFSSFPKEWMGSNFPPIYSGVN